MEGGCHAWVSEDYVSLHLDVNIDFTRNSILISYGIKTEAPVALSYSTVVPRDKVRLEFLIAELNDLDVIACKIVNAYFNAPCKEKIWFKVGTECGDHQGKVMILVRDLYVIKRPGASW